jgi:hypothetical protein
MHWNSLSPRTSFLVSATQQIVVEPFRFAKGQFTSGDSYSGDTLASLATTALERASFAAA